MKKCIKCGNELADNAMFCPKCGTRMDGAVASGNQVANRANSQANNQAGSQSKGSRKNINFVGIAVGVLALILVISFISSSLTKRKHYKPSGDLEDDFFSGTIQIDDQVYDFPCQVSELMDNGWTCENHVKTVESQYYKYVDLTKKGRTFSVRVDNFDDYSIAFEDCYVTYISTDNYQNDEEKKKNLTYPDIYLSSEVGFDTSLKDMAKFVETLDDENVKTDYETEGNHLYHYELVDETDERDLTYRIEYKTDKNEKCMYTLSISFYIRDKEQYKGAEEVDPEISDEVPAEVEDYELPDELGDDATSGRFELDGVVYEIGTPLSAFYEDGWELYYIQGSCRTYLEPSEIGDVIISKGDDNIYMKVENISDKTLSVDNCILHEIRVSYGSCSCDFYMPGEDISTESTEDEVIEFLDDLGVEYYSSELDSWYYSVETKEYEFSFSESKNYSTDEEGCSITIRVNENPK